MVRPLNIPERAPVSAIPKVVLSKRGAHFERESMETEVTLIPIIILTVVSDKELSIQAPAGVKTMPARASGRNPRSLRLRQEVDKTMILRARLETAITGTAHPAGANMQIRGNASKE